MALTASALLSTAGLVVVRSAGVAARTLGLLTLATGMPAERFSHYAIALILSEFARCFTDFGLDLVLLRRAETLDSSDQKTLVRAALAVRVIHGAVFSFLTVAILNILYEFEVLLIVAGLQFVSQGLLQLGLNWRQVNNAAHKAAPVLLLLYGLVISLAAVAYFYPPLCRLPLPLLLVSELAIALFLLYPLSKPNVSDLMLGYRDLMPQALPMATLTLLAFVNTRTDSLLVTSLSGSGAAGQYLYLSRWADLAPMLATGLVLPMVGKILSVNFRNNIPSLVIGIVTFLALPYLLIGTAAYLNPAYATDPLLSMLIATTSAVRIGLSFSTTALLARWQDKALVRIAPIISLVMPTTIWFLGSTFGIRGIAIAVLLVEGGNLLVQVGLLVRRRTRNGSDLSRGTTS